jgi:hypothetical protein
MRDLWEYSISPKGIYYTTRAYHDDLDYHYLVDLGKPDTHKQFQKFLETVAAVGREMQTRDMKVQFKALRDLLG